ncbi:PREDICTED: glutathione S-transferase T2-like [Brassica oleracea var. oleracea]|uniref:glutathione S-transferase T2-like n=1 Tax=Brassica oleracea var. oleracea TaxID=109376 RepID=UPI0006A6DE2A|nr:PREDICTED: glutathione S-transferase T2-like [Brassica oleracea var. oleracea]
MDSYPSSQTSKFFELLNSQQSIFFGNNDESVSLSSSQSTYLGNLGTKDGGESGTERRERRKWTPKDDIVLISSWLNTSKDTVVSNEQRSDDFWTRIAACFAASHQDGGCKQREARHCKQCWHMINDLVCKFCGAYEAASREKTSGQNENDVLKQAHQIFYTNHKKKFLLEHAWKELRLDQKWCEQVSAKTEGSCKKRKCEDGADSSSTQATEMKRPPGVKAAKASGKKTVAEENVMKEFHTMWSIKQQDLAMKDRLSKMRLLESLIAKKDPLAEYEEALKKKLVDELLLS